jgi:hypothetical protein
VVLYGLERNIQKNQNKRCVILIRKIKHRLELKIHNMELYVYLMIALRKTFVLNVMKCRHILMMDGNLVLYIIGKNTLIKQLKNKKIKK